MKVRMVRLGAVVALCMLFAYVAGPSLAGPAEGAAKSTAKCDKGKHLGKGSSKAGCKDDAAASGSGETGAAGTGSGGTGAADAGKADTNATGATGHGAGKPGGRSSGQTGSKATGHPGNNGTIKIDGLPFDSAPNNEPHVGCVFQVDFYNYDQGDYWASMEFVGWPPTGGGTLDVSPTTAFIGEDPPGGGKDVDAQVTIDLGDALAGITPHPKQGYHIKLTIHAPYSQGSDVKHKVFWVNCQSQTSGGSGGAGPGGETGGSGSGAARPGSPGAGSAPGSASAPAGAQQAAPARPVNSAPPFTG